MEHLKYKSKEANILLKKVTDLFHLQETPDWENKAKEEILLSFMAVEKTYKDRVAFWEKEYEKLARHWYNNETPNMDVMELLSTKYRRSLNYKTNES